MKPPSISSSSKSLKFCVERLFRIQQYFVQKLIDNDYQRKIIKNKQKIKR